jgi:hypothetical protein
MSDSYWRNRPRVASILVHVGLNIAMPVGLMSLISYVVGRPALRDFAIYTVAPWTALASVVIVWVWIARGRAGHFKAPPTIIGDVLPVALGWAVGFGALSFAVGSFAAEGLRPMAALDGGISALMAAVASGIALSKQAQTAQRSGEY